MNKHVSGLLALALVLVGCEKKVEEVAEPGEAPAGPVVASELAECPTVGEGGKVAIHDGLEATILSNGYGRAVLLDDQVVVAAKLWIHDETAEGGKGDFVWESGPDGFGFQIGDSNFIEGWSPGIACMLVGEKRELIIASELAYGERGRAPIPPNADIIYDLELLRVAEPEPES